MAAALTVYVSQPAAPPCIRMFEFLRQRGYAYTTVDVVSDEDRAALRARTGYGSCPVVVAGGEVIGKLADTVAADRSGRLSELLAGSDGPAPDLHDEGNDHA